MDGEALHFLAFSPSKNRRLALLLYLNKVVAINELFCCCRITNLFANTEYNTGNTIRKALNS